MYELDNNVKLDQIENGEKREISTEYLKKNPRIGKMEVEEQRFFAYEKQKSHN